MTNKAFQQLLTIIEIKIDEIEDYFVAYSIITKKRFKEIKSRAYGKFEIEQIVREFEEIINSKSIINIMRTVFSGRIFMSYDIFISN